MWIPRITFSFSSPLRAVDCGIADFRTQSPGEMTHTNKGINPQHFETDPADIKIRIRINPVIRILIPDRMALAEFAISLSALVRVKRRSPTQVLTGPSVE